MTNNTKRAATWVIILIIVAVLLYLPVFIGRISYARTAAEVKALRDGLPALRGKDTLSPLFQAVAASVKPAVVVIRTSERIRVQPEPMPDMRDFLRRFFGEEGGGAPAPQTPARPQYYVQQGIGSGIIVDAEKGHILTNWHVVHGAQVAEVVLADGRTLQAEWARADKRADLAIVKVTPDRLISAPMGDSAKVQVGDCVLAIGAPEDLPQTVTSGIISAKGRVTEDGHESFLQTDAAINPGNSGGPLVDMGGHVIGINTAIISPSGVNAGIGLAIPSNRAKKVMAELIAMKTGPAGNQSR
jgi:S1-C subfamily serine protease